MRLLAKTDGGVRAVLAARAARPAAPPPPDRSTSPRLDAAEGAHRRMLAGRPEARRFPIPGTGQHWIPEEDWVLHLHPDRMLDGREIADLEARRLRGALGREAKRKRVCANPALIGTHGFGPRDMTILRITEADDLARMAAARRGGGA